MLGQDVGMICGQHSIHRARRMGGRWDGDGHVKQHSHNALARSIDSWSFRCASSSPLPPCLPTTTRSGLVLSLVCCRYSRYRTGMSRPSYAQRHRKSAFRVWEEEEEEESDGSDDKLSLGVRKGAACGVLGQVQGKDGSVTAGVQGVDGDENMTVVSRCVAQLVSSCRVVRWRS